MLRLRLSVRGRQAARLSLPPPTAQSTPGCDQVGIGVAEEFQGHRDVSDFPTDHPRALELIQADDDVGLGQVAA